MRDSGVSCSFQRGLLLPRSIRNRSRLLCAALGMALFASLMPHCAAQDSSAQNAARQTSLNSLLSELHVGSEFFLNRSETKESVEKHFRLMHENGLTLVRIFVIWDDIERTPGEWNFTGYDWIYDAAAKNGIKIAATLCAEDPPGWMDKTTFYHQRANLDDPAVRTHAEAYIAHVVGRYRNHPAQGAWLLMNEPTKYHADPATFKVFGRWLEKKYGTVDELNKHWFRPIHSFDEVTIEPDQFSDYWRDEEEYLDWKEFNVDNLIATLEWIRGQVEAIDRNHPTHFNVTSPTGDAYGQDVWKEKKVPDILGVSMHAAWAFPRTTPESDFGELYANRLDLIGSASMAAPGKPFWVTELESGPTVYTGTFPLNVTPQDLSRWMWDSYGAGSNAVIFWLWQPRDIGTEAGEWGLVSLDGRPTVRLPAVKSVADVLKQNPGLAAEHPQNPRVAILFNREAAVINNLDGQWQKRQEDVEEALSGCYLALLRAHIPARFVDIDQLKRGELSQYPVLYAPVSLALDDAGIAALKEYVNQGGTLWADGLTAWKNERGRIRPTIPGGLTDVFGVEAWDIYPVQPSNPYSVTPQNEQGGELWKLPLEVKGAEVVLRDGDGNPFEVKHQFGKGQVYYFSSAVTLAYKRRNNPLVQKWIIEPALSQASQMPVQLMEGSAHVIFRGLVGDAGSAAILSNWGDTQTVVVSFRGTHKVKNAVTGEPVAVKADHGNTVATLQLAAGTSAVLMTE
jgi:beta-galactosidase